MTTPTPKVLTDAEKAAANMQALQHLGTAAAEARTYLLAITEGATKEGLEGKGDVEVIGLAAAAKAIVAAKSPEPKIPATPAQTVSAAPAANSTPAELPEDAKRAITFYNQRKAALVKALSGKNGMTDEELNKVDPATLEKMAAAMNATVESVSFAGAAPAPTPIDSKGTEFAACELVFPAPKLQATA